MTQKLITACLGLVALAAFALPATAAAANKPVITHPTGTAMSTRTTTCTTVGEAGCLVGTNIGSTKVKSGDGSTTILECSTAKITGTLTHNSNGTVEGDIGTATFSGSGAAFNGMNECTGISVIPNSTVTTNGTDPTGTFLEGTEDVDFGTPYCLRSTTAVPEDGFQLRGGTCSEAARKITFILDTTPFPETVGNKECKYERSAINPIEGTFTTDTTGDAIMTIVPSGSKFTGEFPNSILCPREVTLEMQLTMETDSATTTPVYISQLP